MPGAGPLEEAVDEVLSAPEITRVLDRALAGSLPEEIARSLVRHRVLERIGAELAKSGELERLVTAALATPQTLELTDKVLSSDETQRVSAPRRLEPELRDAIARQTTGLAEEVVGGVRASAARLDDRAEQILRRPREPDARSTVGSRLARSRLRPTRPSPSSSSCRSSGSPRSLHRWSGASARSGSSALLLASGWLLVVGTYFVLFWSSAGQTPGMRLLHLRVLGPEGRPPSFGRSLVRLVGLGLAIVPLFAGFVPVLFTEKRRGLADFLAGTVVLYDDTRP